MTDLFLRRRWYPMGHAVEIATNSHEALCAAALIWDDYEPLSAAPPVQIRIEAHEGAVPRTSTVTTCQMEHLFAITQDHRSFAIADMRCGIGFIRVSRDALEDRPWFVYHFLEPVAYVLLGARHFAMVHASAVVLDGAAVLLCGPSGAGKTCLAYACAKRGWSFLTGDAAHLVRQSDDLTVIGRPFSIRFRYSAKSLFPELRQHPAHLRPNGKCDIEVDPRALSVAVAMKASAGAIVFLDRREGRPKLSPVARDDARSVLAESIRVGAREVCARQSEALERLLEKPAMQLTYADPFEAEPVLRSLVA